MGMVLPTLDDKMPPFYTNQSYSSTLTQLNAVLKQQKTNLMFQLIFHSDSLQFNYPNWKLSTVKAKLQLLPPSQSTKMSQQMQERESQSYGFVCTLIQVYKLYDLIKCLKRPKITEQTQTPAQRRQQRQCDICFDQISDLVLPCGHEFGAKCISTYIIEKDQRFCPKCRRQYPGRKSVLQRDIYTVIEEDNEIFDEVRLILLETIKQGNEEVVRKVGQSLKIMKNKN